MATGLYGDSYGGIMAAEMQQRAQDALAHQRAFQALQQGAANLSSLLENRRVLEQENMRRNAEWLANQAYRTRYLKYLESMTGQNSKQAQTQQYNIAEQGAALGRYTTPDEILKENPGISPEHAKALAQQSDAARKQYIQEWQQANNLATALNRQRSLKENIAGVDKELERPGFSQWWNPFSWFQRGDLNKGLTTDKELWNAELGGLAIPSPKDPMMKAVIQDPQTGDYMPAYSLPPWIQIPTQGPRQTQTVTPQEIGGNPFAQNMPATLTNPPAGVPLTNQPVMPNPMAAPPTNVSPFTLTTTHGLLPPTNQVPPTVAPVVTPLMRARAKQLMQSGMTAQQAVLQAIAESQGR